MRTLSVRKRIVVAVGAVVALLLVWLLVSRTSGGSQGGDPASTKAGLAGGGGAAGHGRAGGSPADPRTSPRGSIEGRVLDPTGKAVPSARVCGSAWSDELVSADVREPSCVDARPDGSYRLENLMTARYWVQAEAPGHKPGRYRDAERKQTLRLRPGEKRTGIDIVLKPGGVEVRGRVKDISGGVVAGAFVTVSSGGWWSWSDARAHARSNEQGEFVTWTSPGEVAVSARAEGYAEGSSQGTAPGQFIEVLLTPESILVGRVIEYGSERGVAGAIVEVEQESSGGWGWSASSEQSALTDDQGRFRLERLSPGRYKPTATAPGRWGKAAESVLLGLGQTSAEVVIEVHAAVEVSGRVVDAATQEGCREGSVQLRDDQLDRGDWEETAEDGSVHFKAVLPGTYRVSVSCEDFVDGEGFARVTVKDQPVSGLVWEVKRGLTVRGLVVDSTGHPVPEASMWASTKGGAPRAQRSWGNAETADDGTFEIKGLMPATYALHVSAREHPEPKDPPEVTVDKADVTGVRIVLDASGTIEGVVVDEGAQPVGGIEVRALGDRWSWGEGSRSRDDGGFVVEGLRAGEYRVYASRNWDAMRAPGTTDDDIQGQRVTLAAGKTERVRLVVESRRGEIRGRVLDEQGQPVSDAFVDAERESDSKAAQSGSARREMRWAWGDREPVLTDLEGRFTVGKLAQGTYTVNAYRKGGGEAVAEKVAVGTTVTLTIKSTGAISGSVVAGGKPPEEFTIAISDRKEGFHREERFFRTGGRFAMRDLPAGDYDVSASAPEGTDLEKVPLAEGQRRDGLALELEALAKVKGRVVSLEEGKPVAGMRIQVTPVRGGADFIVMGGREDEDRKNITDADGRFEVERASPGKVSVTGFPIDWLNSEYGWCRTIANLEPGKLNDLPPIRVPKRRLQARDRGGDLGFTTRQQPPDVEPDEMRWEVAVIRPGGPAEKTGLKVGDVIVSVDGHDVTGANAYLYWSLGQVPQGTSVAYGLERGETVTIIAGRPQ